MKLAIGIPAYGGKVSAGHMLQAGQLAWAWCKANLPPPFYVHTDTCSIDRARNMLVAKARDAKCDWLLMCDADTYCPAPAVIARMIIEAGQRGAAVVAAPVRLRKRDGYNVKRGDVLLERADFVDQLSEVDAIGSAFMAIRLGWLVEHWPHSPWFRFVHHDGWQPSTTGEDYAFCEGVRQRGGIILADGRFEPAHVGATDESLTLAEIGASRVDI